MAGRKSSDIAQTQFDLRPVDNSGKAYSWVVLRGSQRSLGASGLNDPQHTHSEGIYDGQ